jgi:hypothetical protein
MVGKAFCTILPLLLAGGGVAAQPSTQTPEQAPAAPSACELPAITVELNPVAGSDLATVPIKIGGKPKELLLAIGTNVSEDSSATVKELKLVEGINNIYMTAAE